MKKFVLLTYLICAFGYSQQIEVSNSSSIVIDTGATLNTFGLEMSPSSNFSITNNTISISETPVTVSGATPSISRVYNMANPLGGFSGALSVNYKDAELNGGNESDLNIEIKNGTWTKYSPSIVNQTLNRVTYNGSFTNITMDSVTASTSGTLDVYELELDALIIYPNPTASYITIKSNKNLKTQVYNLLGEKISETLSKSIDLTLYSPGIYILKVIDTDSNKSNTYKIKRQ